MPRRTGGLFQVPLVRRSQSTIVMEQGPNGWGMAMSGGVGDADRVG